MKKEKKREKYSLKPQVAMGCVCGGISDNPSAYKHSIGTGGFKISLIL
jgi:hypothetical protein